MDIRIAVRQDGSRPLCCRYRAFAPPISSCEPCPGPQPPPPCPEQRRGSAGSRAGRFGGLRGGAGQVRAAAGLHGCCVLPVPSLLPCPSQGKYRLGRKIGSGSFGDIYIGAWRQGGGE